MALLLGIWVSGIVKMYSLEDGAGCCGRCKVCHIFGSDTGAPRKCKFLGLTALFFCSVQDPG